MTAASAIGTVEPGQVWTFGSTPLLALSATSQSAVHGRVDVWRFGLSADGRCELRSTSWNPDMLRPMWRG